MTFPLRVVELSRRLEGTFEPWAIGVGRGKVLLGTSIRSRESCVAAPDPARPFTLPEHSHRKVSMDASIRPLSQSTHDHTPRHPGQPGRPR